MRGYILKRRSFIKSSTLAATGFLIGFSFNSKNSLASKNNNKNEAMEYVGPNEYNSVLNFIEKI